MRSLLLAILLAPAALHAQSLVDQEPHNRTALIEEFTGIQNQNAPWAHGISEQIAQVHGRDVALVRMHAGVFAIPQDGQPDFRNTWSTQLFQQFGIAFTPTGAVSRSSILGSLVLSPSEWSLATDVALAQPSPVNLGVASVFDPLTRELSVIVELYYTANGDSLDDHIRVLLTEDHIIGYQADNTASPPWFPDYDHKDVLRAYITDLGGDAVIDNTQGTSVLRTYSFTLPEEFNASNSHVVAFVGEYQGEVYQVKEVNAINGTTAVGIDEHVTSAIIRNAYPQPANELIHLQTTLRGSERAVVELWDNTGRQWSSQRLSAGTTMLDVRQLPSGIYTCRVRSEKGNDARLVVVSH